METTFKLALPENLEIVAALMKEFYQLEGMVYDQNNVKTALELVLNDDRYGRIWLIYAGENLIGYTVLAFCFSLEYGGRDAYADEVYVRESYRDRGIGTKAFTLMEKACLEVGIKYLHLEVSRSNPKAQQLYQRLGFQSRQRDLMTKFLTDTK